MLLCIVLFFVTSLNYFPYQHISQWLELSKVYHILKKGSMFSSFNFPSITIIPNCSKVFENFHPSIASFINIFFLHCLNIKKKINNCATEKEARRVWASFPNEQMTLLPYLFQLLRAHSQTLFIRILKYDWKKITKTVKTY